MGLEGVLLGAHAEGVRNLLAVTGDPPHVGDYPGSRGVYEIDSIGLVQLVTRLNRGEDYVGKSLDAPTSFFCGVAVNPTADDLPLELDRFRRKVEGGARFAMTQALFELESLERFGEPARRLADPRASRRVATSQSHDGTAAPQRGSRHLGALGAARRLARRRAGRTGGRSRAGTRAGGGSHGAGWRGST